MHCPTCSHQPLVVVPGNFGAIIDGCEKCRGIWLDRGEIYLFSKNPKKLAQRLSQNFPKVAESTRLCPRCEIYMNTHEFLEKDLHVECCSRCHGLWFDDGELKRAREIDKRLFGADQKDFRKASGVVENKYNPVRKSVVTLAALPNMGLRSIITLVLLYALLGLFLVIATELGYLTPEIALLVSAGVLLLQFLFSPFIMDITLHWFYKLQWLSPQELPPDIKRFIDGVVKDKRIGFPRIGLIDDGSPNAFTYGHTPYNMRIVITRGILDLLEPDEVKAVIAHEIGHGKNWDMVLMTAAQFVPMVCYYIYKTLSQTKSKKSIRGSQAQFAFVIGAYLIYVLTEYIVLWFSRSREYWADRFAGEVTKNPGFLASALVKIAYGLSNQGDQNKESTNQEEEGESRRGSWLESIGALGIFDAKAARSLVVSAHVNNGNGASRGIERESLRKAMQWDLWNPWAVYYELHSTHPLVAKRLLYLSNQAQVQGKEPYVVFDLRKPESYWDDFLVDIVIHFLPIIFALGGLFFKLAPLGFTIDTLRVLRGTPGAFLGLPIALFGIGYLIQLLFSYGSGFFPSMTIASLLHKVKVSRVRPVLARLRGEIIGKGVPGLIWSEDFVIRDETGILFLDYAQPLAVWEWLFGLLRSGKYIGKKVEVTGWFRRSPVPYLEIKKIRALDGDSSSSSYVYVLKYFSAFLAINV